MKIKLQILGAALCLTIGVQLHAQSIGGTLGIAGTVGVQSGPTCQILTTSLPNGNISASYSQTIQTNYCASPLTFRLIGTLPPGLSLNTSTGNISGTVGNTPGVYAFSVQVTDSSTPSQTYTQKLSITVNCLPFSLNSPQIWPPATVGVGYDYTVPTSGGISPFSFSAINLPSSETIDSSTGEVTGTPASAGIYSTIGITATDSCPLGVQTATGTFTEQVIAALSIVTPPTLPPATTGQPYSTQLAAAGGTPPYTNWQITSGSLPAGFSLGASTGVISASNPGGVGTSNFTVQVTDSASATASLAMTLTVACTPMSFQNQTLPSGTEGSQYSFQEVVIGGFGSISCSGSGYPTGIGINSACLIAGVPTNFGTFTPSVIATDSCPSPQTISIQPPPTLTIAQQVGTLLITTTSPLPSEIVGQTGTLNMAAQGGVPPYTWTQPSGSFPPGDTMNGAGTIAIAPTTAGNYTVGISVTDSRPVTVGPQNFTIAVTCPAESITTTFLPPATKNSAYQYTMQGTGGILPITWGETGLPSGMTFNTATGAIGGTPTVSGTFSVSFTRTDSCLPTGTIAPATLQLQVNNPPLAITTTSLPNGTENQQYSAPLSATGGTPPYTWSILSGGPLQTGLSLTGSTGIIAGTPTASGTVSPLFQVADSASHTATATLSLTINQATGADFRYCSTSETWIGPASDGGANAPQTCTYATLASMPASGTPTVVSTCSALQNAVNGATSGTVIQIAHLNGAAQNVINCQIKPAAACSASNWCIIEPDDPQNLPAEGVQISPAWEGIASLPGRPGYNQPAGGPAVYIPKIISNTNNPTGNAVQFQSTAQHWLIRGVDFGTPPGTIAGAQVIQAPGNHIVFLQDVIHGGNSPTGQDTGYSQAAIAFGGVQYGTVDDSYIYDTHCLLGGPQGCNQSEGVVLGGNQTTTTGPTRIENNFIESAGENIFSGGGGNTPPITTMPSVDCEIRRNTLFKPDFWATGDPSYFGVAFELDNLLELKNSQRCWIEGNTFENSWAQGSQQGNAVLFDPRNQNSQFTGSANSDSAGNITWVSGTQFSANQVSAFCAVPLHCKFIFNGTVYQVATYVSATQITVTPATPTTTSGAFTAYLPGLNPSAADNDIVFRYNYITGAARVGVISATPSDGGDESMGVARVSFHDNVADHIEGYYYNNNTTNGCCVWATGIEEIASGGTMTVDSVNVNHNTFIQWLNCNGVSACVQGLGPGFGWGQNPQTLTHQTYTNNISAAGWGSQSTNAEALWTGWVTKSQLCWDHNFLVTLTTPLGPNGKGTFSTDNNPPYPTASDNGGCTFSPAGNTLWTDFTTPQFANLNGGIGGNYQLLSTSPGHGAASDGTDAGVNWTVLQSYLTGGGSAPPPNPSFTLSVSASTLNVTQGSSVPDTITVLPAGGFNGSVTLTNSSLPSGVTAAYSVNPTTNTSILTLTASASATTGTSTVTITGTSGALTSTAVLTLTVSASSGGGPSPNANWNIAFTMPSNITSAIYFDIRQSNNEWYMASNGQNGDTTNIYKSTNQGQSWTSISSGITLQSPEHFHTIQVNPNDGSLLVGTDIAAGHPGVYATAWRSTNDGSSWTQVTSSPAGWQHQASSYNGFPISSSVVILGTYGAPNLSTIYSSNNGASGTCCGQYGSANGDGLFFSSEYNPVTGCFYFAAEQTGFYASCNGGVSGSNILAGNNGQDGDCFGIANNSAGDTFFACNGGLYRCVGSGLSYTCSVAYGPSQGTDTFQDSFNSMYYSRGNSGDRQPFNSMFRSTGGGTTGWAAWDTGLPQLLSCSSFVENTNDGMIYSLCNTWRNQIANVYRTRK